MHLHPRLPARRSATILTLAILAAITGCADLNLGPQPDNTVGPGADVRSLTDANLQAVQPQVAGDRPGGAADLPGAAMSTTSPATNPATLPAATEPTTTSPGTANAGLHPESQPALGHGTRELQPVPEALSVQEAVLTGLQNNVNLRVQRYNVPISRTREDQALAAFDPSVTGSISGERNQGRPNESRTSTIVSPPTDVLPVGGVGAPIGVIPGSTTIINTPGSPGITDSINASLGYSQNLPTGTLIQASLNSNNSFYSDHVSTMSPSVTITQALLRGVGLDVNLASLRSAELGTKISQYALRGNSETLVESIELAYWDLAFAERQVIIVQNALDVAQAQLDDTSRRVEVGSLSPSELPSARATVAARRVDLINAKSTLETDRLNLLRLITPVPQKFWNRTVALTTLPFIPSGTMDSVEQHVDVALRMRPDVNETKLQIQQNNLQIVVSKNGLLPKLDAFVTAGQTGAGGTVGQSIAGLVGPQYNVSVGLTGQWDPIDRAERATYRADVLSRDQQVESLDNLEQTVQLDVRNQYITVENLRQQIDASRANRIANEEALAVEQAKLRAGNGTSLNVAIAQQNLLSAQLSEVQAVTNHLKSLVTLYRLEGSLLYRRGISAPGSTPVNDTVWHK